MERVNRIEAILRQAFVPQHLVVEDESARHAGHPGARGGGGHYRVLVVAEAFRGLDRVRRHSAVYAALGTLMQSEIHALALRAFTPEEWAAQKQA